MNMSSSPNNNHYGSSSSEAKRRKGNDGGVIGVVHGGFLSTWLSSFFNWLRLPYAKMRQDNEMLVGRLDSMEKLMNKMAEKLELLDYPNAADRGDRSDNDNGEEDSDSSDEEDEGNSDDEESVESLSAEQLEEKGRALVAYQEMIAKNRDEWKYTAEDLFSADINHFDADEIMMLSRSIKACTIKMRRGEYHCQLNEELEGNDDVDELDFYGVLLEPHESVHTYERWVPYSSELRRHWEEFADALNTFDLTLGILDEDVESTFQISHIQLSVIPFALITKALKGKPFRHYKFRNNHLGRGIRALIDIIDSNPALRSLTLHDNPIDPEDQVDFLLSIAKHPNLSAITLDGCCEIGYYIFSGLILMHLVEIRMKNCDWGVVPDRDKQSLIETLAAPDTWLEKLDLSGNNLTDNDAAIFADALQTNNTLKELVLENNQFTERCGQLFGNALRANQTLELLSLDSHIARRVAIYNALFDISSLNSVSDSNHTCYVPFQSVTDLNERLNERDDAAKNRHRKIYNFLARRHKEKSNTQHFGDIDVNLLPEILLAVQNYSSAPTPSSTHSIYDINEQVNALSIVHEIMLKWDKALTLYETLGGSCDGAQK
ncbi:hypothetical protein ACHAWC_009866 [Mediolabrus comicus]